MKRKHVIGFNAFNPDKEEIKHPEKLEDAEYRLCRCCMDGNLVTHTGWNGHQWADKEYLECEHGLDPRCKDGSDCPYYRADPEKCAKLVMKKFEETIK